MWLSNPRTLHTKSNNVAMVWKTFLLQEKMAALNAGGIHLM